MAMVTSVTSHAGIRCMTKCSPPHQSSNCGLSLVDLVSGVMDSADHGGAAADSGSLWDRCRTLVRSSVMRRAEHVRARRLDLGG